MVARFKSRYTKLSAMQCYFSSQVMMLRRRQKTYFTNSCKKALDNVPLHDVLLVIGDLNSKVGRSNEGRETIMGKNGCGEMNENGERLACYWGYHL